MSPTATITTQDRQVLDQVRKEYQQNPNTKLTDVISKVTSSGGSTSTDGSQINTLLNFYAKHMTNASSFDQVPSNMKEQVLNAVYASIAWNEQAGSSGSS